MKTLIIALALTFCSKAYGQEQDTLYGLYAKGREYYDQGDLELAKDIFEHVRENADDDLLLAQSLESLAALQRFVGNPDAAIPLYEEILEIGLPSSENQDYGPFLRLVQIASDAMVVIYDDKQMYDSVLYYLDLSEKYFWKLSHCGTAGEGFYEYMERIRFEIGSKISAQQSTLRSLIRDAFVGKPVPLEEIRRLLRGTEDVADLLDDALDEVQHAEAEYDGATMTVYYCIFLDTRMDIGTSHDYSESDKQRFVESIRGSALYAMLRELD